MSKYKDMGFEGRAAVMNICMEVWNDPKVTKDHVDAMTELLRIYARIRALETQLN